MFFLLVLVVLTVVLMATRFGGVMKGLKVDFFLTTRGCFIFLSFEFNLQLKYTATHTERMNKNRQHYINPRAILSNPK